MMKKYNCRTCGNVFEKEASRGRPPVFCQTCRDKNNPKAATQTVSTPNDDLAAIINEIVGDDVPEVVPKKIEVVGKYRVVVTNLGTTYNGDSEREAKLVYDRYVKKSNEGYGQIGNEFVTLFDGDERLMTFNPKVDQSQ